MINRVRKVSLTTSQPARSDSPYDLQVSALVARNLKLDRTAMVVSCTGEGYECQT
jgi:hypothetical protein